MQLLRTPEYPTPIAVLQLIPCGGSPARGIGEDAVEIKLRGADRAA